MTAAADADRFTKEHADELRVELRDLRIPAGHLSDTQLHDVLAAIGGTQLPITRSIGLAADAIAMAKRPPWLATIIGN